MPSTSASTAITNGPASSRDIKSVAEWQQATLATGQVPSANRCVPLADPVPSRFWGYDLFFSLGLRLYIYLFRSVHVSHRKPFSLSFCFLGLHWMNNRDSDKINAPLPDFHRLVNFPDYLAKPRSSPTSSGNGNGQDTATSNGKKNCVMCGKMRVCSASTLVKNGRKASTSPQPSETQQETSLMDDDSAHIIPRQNKGLCTACDVTVWVVVGQDGLEIKWCKGCKNFRPWAAFGDKGSATKCTKCRERQREKYAMQKDEIRWKRFLTNDKEGDSTTGSSSSLCGAVVEDKKEDDETHLAAARGLRNLMNATSV